MARPMEAVKMLSKITLTLDAQCAGTPAFRAHMAHGRSSSETLKPA